jgi:Activator of Hsp90 ATPase homolog 1-like protein
MVLPGGSSSDTRIQVNFEPEAGKTQINLVQGGFPTADMRDEFGSGWLSILDALGRVSVSRATA